MKLEINKPCHENWDTMTPNEQGAFCAVCTTNVIDFSKKNIDEIKAFFSTGAKKKMCGRFKVSQLEELNFDSFFERFSGFKLKRKIAVVIAATFLSWFVGIGHISAQAPHKMGKVKYIPKDTTRIKKPVKDTTHCVKPPKEKEYLKGDVYYEPTPTQPRRKED